MAIIAKLNPIIRGWAAYYRSVVSSKVFAALDHYLWWLIYRWARHTHPNKSKKWINDRYFGRFNKFRNDHWVFGDRDSGAYLLRFAWTNIVRHQQITGSASPDDPALADYWANRRRRVTPPLDGYTLRLLTKQDGTCPLCGDPLLTAEQPPQSPDQWERWWLTVTRKAIQHDHLVLDGRTATRQGTPDGDHTRLIHATCHRRLHAHQRRKPALQPCSPLGLA
jgi:RNA-directed DNA polymerase